MRGKIYNEEKAKQLNNFSGLRFGKITPTDVDGLLDFANKLFVLIEVKTDGVDLPHGQRQALERTCDAIHKAGKMSALLIVTHNTPIEQQIDVAKCQVIECRLNGKRKEILRPVKCKEAVDHLLGLAGLEYRSDNEQA